MKALLDCAGGIYDLGPSLVVVDFSTRVVCLLLSKLLSRYARLSLVFIASDIILITSSVFRLLYGIGVISDHSLFGYWLIGFLA